jgi:hypothetical protein
MALPLLPALLPAIGALAPELLRHVIGEKAGDVADQVLGAVRSAVGADTPEAVEAAIRDPQVAMQLRIRLAEIAAEREAAAEKARQDELKALLSDLASARNQTVALAQAGSAIAWGAPLVSILVLVAFGLCCWVVLTRALPEGSQEIAYITLGTLGAMAMNVVQFWIGSSNGSARKDETLRALVGGAPR